MTDNKTYLSLDPGLTTGWTYMDELNTIIYGEEKFTHKTLYDFMQSKCPDTIICESFLLYAHKAQSMINNTFYPIEMIGVIKLYGEVTCTPIIFQTAAQGKSIWSDDKLKEHRFYSKSKHSRDATRHLLTYLKVHRELREKW